MKYLVVFILAALVGCASPDYARYADANRAIEVARHEADAAKYAAMAQIAGQGDSTAKVAAVMALALGQGSAPAGASLRAPEPNQALQWASILIPSLTQVAGMRYNYLSAQTQSNNAASVAINTNQTMLGIAGKIQAPVITTPAANITTINTLSGNGTMGSGDYITSANQTLSGTGTLGSGAYGTTDTHATDSHAVDTHAVDNHTVTPAPIIVPVVLNPPVVINSPVVINPPVVLVTPAPGAVTVGP